VQSANVAAQTAVYEANRGVVKGYEWCAALEPGYQSGRGTCLRCAALDGQKWDMDEERPDCPLHPRCRCELLPVTKSWRELGLDIDEIEEVARPWTMRPDENIDAGGRRAITEHGFHNGDYGSWYAKQDSEFQADLAGKKRAELLASGDVKFHDLVDRKTGRLLRLDELTGEKAKPGNLAAKSPMEAERILRDVGLSDKDKAALKAYTGRDMQQLNKALRDKSGVSTTSRKLARDLSTALSKLPMFVGTVYRGLRFESDAELTAFAANLASKRTDYHTAFTSSSTRLDLAKHYASDGLRVIYTIKSKSGRSLGEHSAVATTPKSITEHEVLFDRRSCFRSNQ